MLKHETILMSGEIPTPRFGHTMIQGKIISVSKDIAILFGGATGDTNHYNITSETYVLFLNTYIWKKLECLLKSVPIYSVPKSSPWSYCC